MIHKKVKELQRYALNVPRSWLKHLLNYLRWHMNRPMISLCMNYCFDKRLDSILFKCLWVVVAQRHYNRHLDSYYDAMIRTDVLPYLRNVSAVTVCQIKINTACVSLQINKINNSAKCCSSLHCYMIIIGSLGVLVCTLS